MITERDRSIVRELLELEIWKLQITMRLPDIVPTDQTEPLKDAMLKRQSRDDLHHAPCCPANHYHYRRLVLRRCNCGAQRYHDEQNPPPETPEPELYFQIEA